MSEIFYDHEGVVVSLDEPVKLLIVVVVTVFEGLLSFAPQIVSSFRNIEIDSPKITVLLRAHEDQLVTVRAPSLLHVDGLKVNNQNCLGKCKSKPS